MSFQAALAKKTNGSRDVVRGGSASASARPDDPDSETFGAYVKETRAGLFLAHKQLAALRQVLSTEPTHLDPRVAHNKM